MKDVRKVVFPVAGLGTRFLPATKAMPKEMLPVVDKPLIQYAVEEAYAAGITEMIFITGRYKRAIEDHFDKAPMLEKELIEKGKTELLQTVRSIAPMGVTFIYIRQPEPLGLGHAVLCAQPVVGDEPRYASLGFYQRGKLVDSRPSTVFYRGNFYYLAAFGRKTGGFYIHHGVVVRNIFQMFSLVASYVHSYIIADKRVKMGTF